MATKGEGAMKHRYSKIFSHEYKVLVQYTSDTAKYVLNTEKTKPYALWTSYIIIFGCGTYML